MASSLVSSAFKASISSLMTQSVSQLKQKTSPPSPPPAPSFKDLQGALQMTVLDIKGEIKDFMAAERLAMEELLEKKIRELRDDIFFVCRGFVKHIEKIEDKMDEVIENAVKLESRVEEVENKIQATQEDLSILQYRQMEFALRIRGLRENLQGDLKTLIVTDIAFNLGWQPEELGNEIEIFFRVNSWVARERNLPRDVVIYFSRRFIRNEIIQSFYKQRFQIAAQDVIILKEIPSKILRRRKDFTFLSDELKCRQIQFRWEIPTGIAVNYDGTRYRLTTVSKAKDFYSLIMKEGSSSSPQIRKMEESATMEHVELAVQNSEIIDQRMKRVASKRKEKEHQQKMGGKNRRNCCYRACGRGKI